MTMHTLDETDEDTRYISEVINDNKYLITACRTEQSGIRMLALLETLFNFAWFDLSSDRPSLRLDEYDYDRFLEYRHELIRPVPNAQHKPKLIVIDGGLDK